MEQRRLELINEIESLYPPDASPDGPELLTRALCAAWRTLPMPILESLLAECGIHDREGCRGQPAF